jgi:hypothetical protein
MRHVGLLAIALCVIGSATGTASAQPGGTFTYSTSAVGNQRFASVQGLLNPLGPGQRYLGVWIRAYDAAGNQLSEGQITLLNNLQFGGTLGDFQMASFAVVVRYRQGNGPIQAIVSQKIPWKP